MNKDEISGKVDQVVGKVKQGVGDGIGNQKVANQGVIDQAKGAAKETWGNAKDAAKQVGKSQKETAGQKADNVRHLAIPWKRPRRKLKRKLTNLKIVTLNNWDPALCRVACADTADTACRMK
jgi:uncharacterized protein YjbJ (UPF0337 family)